MDGYVTEALREIQYFLNIFLNKIVVFHIQDIKQR